MVTAQVIPTRNYDKKVALQSFLPRPSKTSSSFSALMTSGLSEDVAAAIYVSFRLIALLIVLLLSFTRLVYCEPRLMACADWYVYAKKSWLFSSPAFVLVVFVVCRSEVRWARVDERWACPNQKKLSLFPESEMLYLTRAKMR
jgi:hypothetical protein